MKTPKAIIVLLALVIGTNAISQPLSEPEGGIDDGPYLFSFFQIINAIWIENNALKEEVILPDNYESMKSLFGFTFSYRDLHNTLNLSPDFRQKFRKADSICVISDVHGNFDTYIGLLRGAGIIDENNRWSFGKGHLVVLGDILDRGAKVTEILWHVFDLEKQAGRAGGKVHVLLGNHEFMVLNNDLRYVNEKYTVTEKLSGISYSGLFSDNSVLGRWLRTRPVAMTINDILFIHGGVSTDIVEKGLKVKDINKTFYRDIIGKDLAEAARDEKLFLLIGDKGPLWYRGFFTEKGVDENDLSRIMEFYGVKNIVVGHTPDTLIRSLNNNKIFGVDAGIMNDLPGELLLIKNNGFYRLDRNGIRKKIGN